jgi:hypothetical protein
MASARSLLALSAAFVLVAPYSTFAAYATSLGYLLLICAIAAFLDWRHEVKRSIRPLGQRR